MKLLQGPRSSKKETGGEMRNTATTASTRNCLPSASLLPAKELLPDVFGISLLDIAS